MIAPHANFYAAWRAECRAANELRDRDDFPSERLLQAVWQHQRLRRDSLRTPDGRVVRIFHPGFASAEGGPDFRGAVLQIGGDAPRTGDVEVDLRSHGWRAHGHDRNPHFRSVILHVVWEAGALAGGPPETLPLRDSLDAPLDELGCWLENEPTRDLPKDLRGRCAAQLQELDDSGRTELLDSAARVRFQSKAAHFRARARLAGWEQSLWEGLFRALGYKHNVWPMQNLAESRPAWSRGAQSPFEFQARLLGVGGLLPAELTRAQKSSDRYLRRLWDAWWRERDAFEEFRLPRGSWRFHCLRPANHPQRRLALASHWLAAGRFIPKIEAWLTTGPTRRCHDSLREILRVERDEFWSRHWTFRSAPLSRPHPLLGEARVTDLAVNVILPWLWARAVEGGNGDLQREAEQRYHGWPAAEDNSVLKLARQRMLGTTGKKVLPTAAAQQGLMQIVRDFCERTNAVCDQCPFPRRLEELGSGNSNLNRKIQT